MRWRRPPGREPSRRAGPRRRVPNEGPPVRRLRGRDRPRNRPGRDRLGRLHQPRGHSWSREPRTAEWRGRGPSAAACRSVNDTFHAAEGSRCRRRTTTEPDCGTYRLDHRAGLVRGPAGERVGVGDAGPDEHDLGAQTTAAARPRRGALHGRRGSGLANDRPARAALRKMRHQASCRLSQHAPTSGTG